MSNELRVSVSLRFEKSGRSVQKEYSGVQIDVSGDKWTYLVQEIGTSEEAIDVGDIGTAGFIIFKNLDDTNYVTLRPGTGTTDLVKAKSGEPGLFRLAMDGPYAMADTAACDLELLIIED